MKIKKRNLKIGTFGTIGAIVSTFLTQDKVIENLVLFWALIIPLATIIIFICYWLFFCIDEENNQTKDTSENEIAKPIDHTIDKSINSDGIFEGRDDEIEDILKLLKKNPIVVIKGSPGLGKSTLAQYFLKDKKTEREFKRKYFVKLENSESVESNDKSSKEYIAEQILRSFMEGYEDDVSFITQVETRLKNMSDAIIVLDNTEQVKDEDLNDTIIFWSQNLSSNIRFILTSRRKHLGVNCIFELKPLLIRKFDTDEKTEACRVLIQKLQLIRNGWTYDNTKENNLALFEITKKTEGVPWCIDAAVGIFKSKNYSLPELSKSIQSIVTPKDDLYRTTELFFEKSFIEMHPEVQNIFIQTCIFDGDFKFNDFHEVVLSELDKDNLIDELTKHSFLRNLDDGYYSLYIHVKEFGEKKLKKLEEKKYQALIKRFSNHYLNSIKSRTKENIRKEVGNYIKTQKFLIEDLEVDKAADLTLSLDKAIEAKGSSGVREKLIKISYGPFSNEANQTKIKLGLRLSEIYFALGDWIKAESYAKKSIHYAKENSILKARSFLKLGKIYKERGFLHEALRLFDDCYAILKENKLKDNGVFEAYYSNKLNVLDQLGELEKFNSILEDLDFGSNDDEIAKLYNRIGLKEWHHSNINESIKAFDQAISIAKKSKNETWEAAYNTNKALAQIDINKFNEALIAFNSNISTHRISGRKAWQSVTFGGKGRALLRRNSESTADYIGAYDNLITAFNISKELGYPENITWLKGDLARLYLNQNKDDENDLKKSHVFVKEALSIHRKCGSIRNIRYFSNCITFLIVLEKLEINIKNIEFIETLYVLLDLYKNYILIDIKTPTEFLQNDIDFLNMITQKYCDINLDDLEKMTISKVLNKLSDTQDTFEKEIKIIKHNIINQKEGSYEYYADQNENQWKYFNPKDTVDIFVYGILLHKDYLKLLKPITPPKPVKAIGVVKKCNHVLPNSAEYFNKDIFSDGRAILNVDYTGFCSDKTYGLLIRLNKESFKKFEINEKGYALRSITLEMASTDNKFNYKIIKAYTLTSTGRVYLKQKLTNNFSKKNKAYLKLCEEGALSYGKEFYELWKDF